MLEQISSAGGKKFKAKVLNIENNLSFELETDSSNGTEILYADSIVNAAGPFAKKLASMMKTDLPIENIFHQKIAFEDTLGAVPRARPFSIDLDENVQGWTNEKREWLSSEPELSWLAGKVAGGTLCRPEGGDSGNWVKLGWAYNQVNSEPQQDLHNEPRYDSRFPEIVMRAASRLQPALLAYRQDFPKPWSRYGGYYSMTKENWPLIGPAGQEGSYGVGALSGYGSMAACAAGSLVACHITGKTLPEYASHLSLDRYEDQALMNDITTRQNTGIL